MTKKNVIKFMGMCVMSFLIFGSAEKIIYLNLTDSVPRGVYMRVPKNKIMRGDYIIYEPTEKIQKIMVANGWSKGKEKFLKIVVGIRGDKYEIGENFIVNGKNIGRVFAKDSAGHELPKIYGKYKVEEGEILPAGTNVKSFDGRYTGTIKESEIEAKVVPIILID